MTTRDFIKDSFSFSDLGCIYERFLVGNYTLPLYLLDQLKKEGYYLQQNILTDEEKEEIYLIYIAKLRDRLSTINVNSMI